MKVFIIDDEPKIRRGLANIVMNYHSDWPIPNTAVSAEEALENPDLKEADLLFLDINLPGMSGLDLLQLVKPQMKKELQVIIISGYADFAYAQKSIQLSARGYLLKPVDIHKLRQILDDAEIEIQDIQKHKNELQLINNNLHNLRRDFFASVLSGTYQLNTDEYNNSIKTLELNDSAFAVLIFQADCADSDGRAGTDAKYLFSSNLKEALSNELDCYITGTTDIMTAVFIWKDYCNKKAVDNTSIAQETADEHSFKTGVSAVHFSYSEILSAYHEAWQCLQVVRREADPVVFEHDQTNYVDTIIKKRASYHPAVQQAVQFIMREYASPIKVEQIASRVYVHSNYLSDLFKRETGGNLSTFITDYRLYQAKKKLYRLENKLYMISEQVGFNNEHYFSQVFKKRIGVSPNRYRSLCFGVISDEQKYTENLTK